MWSLHFRFFLLLESLFLASPPAPSVVVCRKELPSSDSSCTTPHDAPGPATEPTPDSQASKSTSESPHCGFVLSPTVLKVFVRPLVMSKTTFFFPTSPVDDLVDVCSGRVVTLHLGRVLFASLPLEKDKASCTNLRTLGLRRALRDAKSQKVDIFHFVISRTRSLKTLNPRLRKTACQPLVCALSSREILYPAVTRDRRHHIRHMPL